MWPQDVACAVARQVEIAVLREIGRRGLVGGGEVFEDHFVLVGERVRHPRPERARIAFLAVWARVRQDQSDAVRVLEGLRVPDHLVEAAEAAMEVIGTVVLRECVGLAIQREPPARDPIGVSADDRAEYGDSFRYPSSES